MIRITKAPRDKILITSDLINECLGFVRLSAESAQLSIAQEDWKGMAYHVGRMICYVRATTKCADDIAEFNRELPGDKVPNYRREDGE